MEKEQMPKKEEIGKIEEIKNILEELEEGFEGFDLEKLKRQDKEFVAQLKQDFSKIKSGIFIENKIKGYDIKEFIKKVYIPIFQRNFLASSEIQEKSNKLLSSNSCRIITHLPTTTGARYELGRAIESSDFSPDERLLIEEGLKKAKKFSSVSKDTLIACLKPTILYPNPQTGKNMVLNEGTYVVAGRDSLKDIDYKVDTWTKNEASDFHWKE